MLAWTSKKGQKYNLKKVCIKNKSANTGFK